MSVAVHLETYTRPKGGVHFEATSGPNHGLKLETYGKKKVLGFPEPSIVKTTPDPHEAFILCLHQDHIMSYN